MTQLCPPSNHVHFIDPAPQTSSAYWSADAAYWKGRCQRAEEEVQRLSDEVDVVPVLEETVEVLEGLLKKAAEEIRKQRGENVSLRLENSILKAGNANKRNPWPFTPPAQPTRYPEWYLRQVGDFPPPPQITCEVQPKTMFEHLAQKGGDGTDFFNPERLATLRKGVEIAPGMHVAINGDAKPEDIMSAIMEATRRSGI